MISLNLTPPIRWGLNLLILLAGVILLRLGQAFFIPPVIALLLAAVLWPGAGWLHQKLRMPWSLACLTGVTGVFVLNLIVTLGFRLAAARLLKGMPNPNYPAGQQQLYTQIREKVQLVSPFPLEETDTYWPQRVEDSRLFHYVQETIQKNINNILLSAAYYGNSWIWQWVLIMFILLFLLLEGRMLSRRAVEIVGPSKEVQEKAGAALSDMAHQVRSFLMWRTVVNVLLGVCVGVFYYALGLKEPWTWALLTAVLCYVPYLGPIVAGVPAVLDAFLSCPSPWYALVVLLVYIVMITVEGYIVVPVVMGRSMEMNATTVMLACLFWELIWGLPGLFMAMPLMAAIKAVCAHMPEMRPWANLMSLGESEEPPEFKPDPKSVPAPPRRPDLEALAAVVGELPSDEPPASASSPRIGGE
ncbi:MAG: AI-2E family transporter [Planctomycetia bacterium]|nr:AI-2E family transporter [Planctomycetia bacterium]